MKKKIRLHHVTEHYSFDVKDFEDAIEAINESMKYPEDYFLITNLNDEILYIISCKMGSLNIEKFT
jgi:hypothetical protein